MLSKSVQLVRATTEMLLSALAVSKPRVDEAMTAIAVSLHDLLFVLAAEEMTLKNKIATMCESWWKADLPEKEQLAPQTIAYFLMKSLVSG